MPSPTPCSCSHSVILALASTTPRPSSEISSLAELTSFASYEPKASSQVEGSVPRSSDGWTTQRIGSSKARAKAKSRASCAGTAMIAPVP
ncbi:hypothetical protein SCYAM73S_08579 [Streptomyces cyaneofuscatus]